MSERGMIGSAFHKIFGPRAPDFCVGLALFVGICLTFLVSIWVMPELNWRTLAQSSAVHKEVAIALDRHDDIADRLDAYRIQYLKLVTNDKPNTNLQIRRNALFDLIKLEQTNLTAAEATLTSMRDKPSNATAIDDLQLARYSGVGNYFPRATPGQLVLILTLMMGFLGGIMAVARAFVLPVDDKQPTASDYIIRPLLGAVIAFVIFILVHFTQAMISAEGATDLLNPYPVVLIAVVAGFLATDAIDAIERWGKALLGRISTTSSVPSVNDPNHKLAAERDRLTAATRKIGTDPPTPADPANPTQPEQAAKAAYDKADAALTEANDALTKGEAAIQKLTANATATAVAAANSALADLTRKVTTAVNLIDAVK